MAFLVGLYALAFPALAPWCGQARISGYLRTEFSPYTYDGTSIFTREPIAAASWDVKMGSLADIEGLGTFRIADRGMLGNGIPMPWVDVAVWYLSEAYALTGTRHVCFRPPSRKEGSVAPYNDLPPFVLGSDTSEAAALSQRRRAPTQRERVYSYMALQGDLGTTDSELEVALEMLHQTVSARRRELELQDRVRKTDERRRTSSGKTAGVYVVVTPQTPLRSNGTAT